MSRSCVFSTTTEALRNDIFNNVYAFQNRQYQFDKTLQMNRNTLRVNYTILVSRGSNECTKFIFGRIIGLHYFQYPE